MKRAVKFILAALLFSYPFSAHTGLLQKLSEAELKSISLPGYFVNTDQAFKITSGPLAGKVIFFAAFEPGSAKTKGPQFVIMESGKVVDAQTLPTLVEGWNIVEVEAVTAIAGQGSSALRILSVLTLEPISNRPQDYWSQAFVFDLAPNGKINVNADLNQKVSTTKPKIKTIEALKNFLKTR